MCGGGGAGGSGTQKFEWNENIAPFWQGTLDLGNALRQRPYQQYTGQRIAFQNQDQQDAMGAIRRFAHDSGSPTTKAADGSTYQTLTGNFLKGANQNPYTALRNQYGSMDSPYFKAQKKEGMQDIVDAYQQGTSAETTRQMNMAGVLGGDAHLKAVANNQAGLGKTLARYGADRDAEQYNRSAGIEETFLGRGNQNFENERGRMMQAIPLGNQQQQLALDRYKSLLGVGDMERQYQQEFLNQNFNDWQEQQGYEFKMADWFSGLLGRAQGGMSPNMTYTTPGYQSSPFSQFLGGGLAAYGLSR